MCKGEIKMRFVFGALLILVSAGLLASSCQSLALSGPKKFKVDLQNVLVNMDREITNDGHVSDKTSAKLDAVLLKYQGEYAKLGSFMTAQQIQITLQQVKTEPNNEFNLNKSIMMNISEVNDMLKTEVQS